MPKKVPKIYLKKTNKNNNIYREREREREFRHFKTRGQTILIFYYIRCLGAPSCPKVPKVPKKF